MLHIELTQQKMFDEYPQTTAQYLLFKQINTRFRNPEISNIVLLNRPKLHTSQRTVRHHASSFSNLKRI
ncbi:hypothetical protein HMPREF9098_2220 [Kingella denitrificans ATCC 33394]|uniref:Uncharacterized protein n=1 Tax=Kingella denitrificans ATCC 33394 TaxID=888741 RepID=F0F285_9NEIS|nr:hypothetical protein HMPREF9098_2220 [Kingella denitrificans ATCC 33394]